MRQTRLALMAGFSQPGTISRAIRTLRETGWLRLERTAQGNRKHYRLTIPLDDPEPVTGEAPF